MRSRCRCPLTARLRSIPRHAAAWLTASNERTPCGPLDFQANGRMQLASPLHLAADNNWPHTVEALLKHGAVISAQTKVYMMRLSSNYTRYSASPLAEPHLAEQEGWTALHYAAEQGYLDVVRKLLAAAAPVGVADEVRSHTHAAPARPALPGATHPAAQSYKQPYPSRPIACAGATHPEAQSYKQPCRLRRRADWHDGDSPRRGGWPLQRHRPAHRGFGVCRCGRR